MYLFRLSVEDTTIVLRGGRFVHVWWGELELAGEDFW